LEEEKSLVAAGAVDGSKWEEKVGREGGKRGWGERVGREGRVG